MRKLSVKIGTTLAVGVAMALVMALALAGPALAKGEEDMGVGGESVAIVGPGLPGGSVSLTGGVAPQYAEMARVFSGTKMTISPTAIDLGPGFEVLYTIDCQAGGSRPSVVSYRQILYPYASFGDFAGPWTFTPAGQPQCSFLGSPGAGWMAASRDLMPLLVDNGIPASVPSVPDGLAPVPVNAPVPSGGPPVWVLAILGAMLTAGLVTAGLLGRLGPRRRATV